MSSIPFSSLHPRRPFNAKGSNVVRCDSCMLAKDYCICAHRDPVWANMEVWLLMHREEAYKPTNTGRLIEDTIPENSRRFYWHRTEPDPEFIALLNDDRYQAHIIFPDDRGGYDERVVYEPICEKGKIPAFIILDGSWRQAGRMFRLSRYLQKLPVLPIKTQRLSEYKLRKAPDEFHLCTAEVAMALMEMMGEVQAAESLQNLFNEFNLSYAKSRRNYEPAESS